MTVQPCEHVPVPFWFPQLPGVWPQAAFTGGPGVPLSGSGPAIAHGIFLATRTWRARGLMAGCVRKGTVTSMCAVFWQPLAVPRTRAVFIAIYELVLRMIFRGAFLDI